MTFVSGGNQPFGVYIEGMDPRFVTFSDEPPGTFGAATITITDSLFDVRTGLRFNYAFPPNSVITVTGNTFSSFGDRTAVFTPVGTETARVNFNDAPHLHRCLY